MKEKLFLWVLLVLVGTCLGRFVVEKKCLRVISASDSFGDVYECAIDNIPQYAGTMVGTVIYPRANQKACRAFDDVGVSFKSRPGGLPVFLLADRGDCFFALKAWRAQEAGAAAILLADDIVEPLITMYTPEEESIYHIDAIANITIPTALISKAFGNNIKKALWNGDMVNINLNWTESVPLPNEKVEYEFWTNSNYECGPQCRSQIEFIKNFKGVAQALEQKGYIKFTPHYITWYCPEAFVLSRQCRSHCINRGRYCALDSDWETSRWYEGKDIVFHNLMQACLYKIAGESGKPWLWWDYVTDFSIRCSMKKKKYNKGCADNVIQSLGIDLKKIDECLGDINADVDIPILKAEQDAQISKGSRGDVTMLPTLVINNRQYRGKLDKGAVLKAICAGFQETAKPSVCSSDWIETNERLENSGGRWQDEGTDITASMIEEKASAVEESVTASDKFTVKIMREDEAGSRNKISDRYVIIDMDDTEVPNSVSDTIPQSIIRKVLGILHI